MLSTQNIIVVATEFEAHLQSLVRALRAHGFHLLETTSAEAARALIERTGDVAVVVYDAAGANTAHRVLQSITDVDRKIPVIVVVERGSFEEYYELMCEGAYDYFEVANGAEEIERSVRWAAGTRAA